MAGWKKKEAAVGRERRRDGGDWPQDGPGSEKAAAR